MNWGSVVTTGGNLTNSPATFGVAHTNTTYNVVFGFEGTSTSGRAAADWLGTAITQTRSKSDMTFSVGGYSYRAFITKAYWTTFGY